MRLPWRVNSMFLITLRTGVGLLFCVTGVQKLIWFRSFHAAIVAFRIIPESCVSWFGIGVLSVELFLGASLLVKWNITLDALFGTILLATFTGAMVYVLASGRKDVPCGCFILRRSSSIGVGSIVRNVSLGALL